MTASGTYNFSPEVAEVVDESFERAGVDPETLTARHLRSARRSMNFIFSDWANEGIKLWQIEQETLTLVQGTATYNTPSDTIGLLEVFVRRDGIDTIVEPMARDEHAAVPNKTTQGMISQYYFDRQSPVPTITLWQVPENATDVVHYYRWRQMQDVGSPSNTADVPYRWLEALTAELAARLSGKYNPEREGNLTVKADEAFRKAKIEDRQRTPTFLRVSYGRGRR